MDTLLNRYRNLTVLLLVIFAQLVLVALQVRNDRDVPMIRVWSVTAVSPFARILETVRGGTVGFFQDYILMHDARQQNRRLQEEVDRLKMENLFLKTELSTADRAKALVAFQEHTQSKTIGARVIATGSGVNTKVVYLDRGSSAGVERGMPVVTPDGIIGKVIAAYPTASEVMLVTDPEFAAGVISQKNQAVGTLKGQGQSLCKIDYVPNEENIEIGETFYTSGDDRVFPKGFPVGVVRVVRNGSPYKEILLEPSGLQRGMEAVLIMVQGVHQPIPELQPANTPVYLGPPPPSVSGQQPSEPAAPAGTDADRLRKRYQQIGEAQGHKFGEGLPGSKPPDFNLKPQPAGTPPAAAAPPTVSPKPGPAKQPAPSVPPSGPPVPRQ